MTAPGRDGLGLWQAGVEGEIVARHLHGAAGARFAHVLDEEVRLEGVGVVVVQGGAFGQAQVPAVTVVRSWSSTVTSSGPRLSTMRRTTVVLARPRATGHPDHQSRQGRHHSMSVIGAPRTGRGRRRAANPRPVGGTRLNWCGREDSNLHPVARTSS